MHNNMLEKSEMERETGKMREREIEREKESQIMVVFSKCDNFKTPIGVNKGEHIFLR